MSVMRRWLYSAALLVAALALAACAAEEKAAPAPPAQAPEAILPRKDAWQEEWERVLAAAKREGKVAVMGPVGADVRTALTAGFEKKFGISVELLAGAGPEQVERLKPERAAGQYLWDVFIGGTSIHLQLLRPLGALDPIEPILILPEAKDPKSYLGGKLPFADKDGVALLIASRATSPVVVNTSLVKPDEFRSWKDLLDPKWKGKIGVFDPRIAGSGQAGFTFFYQHKELGPDFLRALARQDLTLTRDYRQQLEWLAQGKFPIAIGGHGGIEKTLKDAGQPIKRVDTRQVREGSFLASGTGTVGLVNRAPHPNAARVYINWLLTKEGQTAFAVAAAYGGTRVDVPADHLEPWERPREDYWNIDTEEARNLETRVVGPFVKGLFGE